MAGLFDTIAGLRDAVVSALAAGGRPAFDRVVISDGADVAYDCEQLVLAVEAIRTGLPGVPDVVQLDGRVSWTAVVAVHAVRCAPTLDDQGNPPSPEEITASAESVAGDGDALMRGAFDYAQECRRAAVATLTFPGPLGGYAVALLRLEVLLV